MSQPHSADSLACAFTALIPARMASSRLPNKPLADIGGLPMVVRVAQRAARSAAQRVVVAADDERIVQACNQHGIEALLTSPHHPSGSDRLAQACEMLGLDDDHIVVNVQGDEPLIDPALIDAVAHILQSRPDASMGTIACPIHSWDEYQNPNAVKVVLDARNIAQYFSRAPIPYARDHHSPWWTQAENPLPPPLRHIGIYSYRTRFLKAFPHLAPAPTEQLEALEQLRALWHGHAIAVHVAPEAPGPGVDTSEDLARVRALVANAVVS